MPQYKEGSSFYLVRFEQEVLERCFKSSTDKNGDVLSFSRNLNYCELT